MEKVKMVFCLVVVLGAVALCSAVYNYPPELNGTLVGNNSGDTNVLPLSEYAWAQSWENPAQWSYGHVPTADEDVSTILCSPNEPWQLHIHAPAVAHSVFMQGADTDAGDHMFIFDGGSLTVGGTDGIGGLVMGPTAPNAPDWGAAIPKHIPEVYVNAGGSLFAGSLQVSGDQGRLLNLIVNGSVDVDEIRVRDIDGTTTNYLSMLLQGGTADIGLGTINELGTGSAGSLVSIDILGGTLVVVDAGFAADLAAGVILAEGVGVTAGNIDSLLTVSSAGGITTASLIPEPATISLLALGGLGFIRRRRSR